MLDDDAFDKYERYASLYDSDWQDQHTRRSAGAKDVHKPKKSREQVLAELTDEPADLEAGFKPSYRPSRHEAGWLLDSLRAFYEQGLITDVLWQVKGGKEATVYCCEAHPATGLGLVAAKVYRPRMFRNLRNDAVYREGREVLTAEGRPAGKQAGTIARAIRNKTAFGLEAAHTSWLMHEYAALELLHQAGASVPRPLAGSENAVLMSYHGDRQTAAPTLNTVELDPQEAQRLFGEVVHNIDLMLQVGLVHGDLSAYNVLYWRGKITLIDFPQVVTLQANTRARQILERDVRRISEYFWQQGVHCRPGALARDLWSRYVHDVSDEEQAADWSRLVATMEQAG